MYVRFGTNRICRKLSIFKLANYSYLGYIFILEDTIDSRLAEAKNRGNRCCQTSVTSENSGKSLLPDRQIVFFYKCIICVLGPIFKGNLRIRRINMEIPCDIGTYYGIRSMSFY